MLWYLDWEPVVGITNSFYIEEGCDWVQAGGGAPGWTLPLEENPLLSMPLLRNHHIGSNSEVHLS